MIRSIKFRDAFAMLGQRGLTRGKAIEMVCQDLLLLLIEELLIAINSLKRYETGHNFKNAIQFIASVSVATFLSSCCIIYYFELFFSSVLLFDRSVMIKLKN